jgi:hypothetical protein
MYKYMSKPNQSTNGVCMVIVQPSPATPHAHNSYNLSPKNPEYQDAAEPPQAKRQLSFASNP